MGDQTLLLLNAMFNPGNKEESTPVPVPRKSLSSPPLERANRVGQQENTRPASQSQRKTRLAQLAQNIDNWEDDLSHPTIV